MTHVIEDQQRQSVRVMDLVKDPEFKQSQYIQKTAILGSYEIGVFDVRNNPQGDYPDPPLSEFSLQILTQASSVGTFDLGTRNFASDCAPGAMLLAPPNTTCFYSMECEFSLVNFGLPTSLFDEALRAFNGAHEPDLERMHDDTFRDPRIEALGRSLFDGVSGGQPQSALFVDQAAFCIAALLVERAGKMTRRPGMPVPLSDTEFSQAMDMMQDRMEDGVTLSELAELSGRNVYQFSRAFRLRTGVPPYKFLLWLRVDRARHMIETTKMPLVEIAYACGFSSQAHFTTVFSKTTGMTPGILRARS